MTLRELADTVIHQLEGGDKSKDSHLDRRDFILKARQYAALVLKPVYFEKLNEGDGTAISQAIYTHEGTLEKDDGGRQYIEVPDGYMNLTHNRGIHRVFIKGNVFQDFVLQHHPGITSNLDHMQLGGLQFCYIEGRRIYMGSGCKASRADKIVVQTINPAPSSLSETDHLPASPEQIAEIMRLLVAEYMPLLGIPVDTLNNQNPNIR